LLLRLFQTARRFNMEVQPQLVLLQKTLLNIEGLGRQLYPDLDLWKTAKPFLENWMQDQVGPRAMMRNIKDDLPYLIEKMPEMPSLIYKSLKAYTDGEHQLKQTRAVEEINQRLAKNHQSSLQGIIGGSLFIGATVIYSLASGPLLWGVPMLSLLFGSTGGVLMLFAIKK